MGKSHTFIDEPVQIGRIYTVIAQGSYGHRQATQVHRTGPFQRQAVKI